MKFELTEDQVVKLNEWLQEKMKVTIEEQRKTMDPEDFDFLTIGGTVPYHGSSGGSVTFCFTPTSLGHIVIAKYMEDKIDLTDYEVF